MTASRAPGIGEPRYDVVWPLSRKAVQPRAAAPRVRDLNGTTIGELWDVIFRGEMIYPLLRKHLQSRYPGARFVEHSEFGNFYGPREKTVVAQLPEKLRGHDCGAAIVGIGA